MGFVWKQLYNIDVIPYCCSVEQSTNTVVEAVKINVSMPKHMSKCYMWILPACMLERRKHMLPLSDQQPGRVTFAALENQASIAHPANQLLCSSSKKRLNTEYDSD